MRLQSISSKIINKSIAVKYINSRCCKPAGRMWEKQKTVLGEFEGSNAVVRIADPENTGIMIPTVISNNGSAWCISDMVHSCVLGIKEHGEQLGDEAGGLTEATRISRVSMRHVPHASSWSQEECKRHTMVARLGGIYLQSKYCRNWGRIKSLRRFCAT